MIFLLYLLNRVDDFPVNRGSYKSVQVLLNLLNQLWKMVGCRALLSILSFSATILINSILNT